MTSNDTLFIGILVKTRGVNGELILEVEDSFVFENIKEAVFVDIDGLPVPFFVKQITPLSENRASILFYRMNNEKSIKELVNCKVFMPIKHLKNKGKEISPSLLIGFNVIDKNYGDIGKIQQFINQENNPLLLIKKDNNEILIPFHQSFISEMNLENRMIFVNTPEGLIDLYM